MGNLTKEIDDTDKIKLSSIRKKFKDETVLDDISAEFESGKIYGIVGHNGSVKTVLFKCICGFYQLKKERF